MSTNNVPHPKIVSHDEWLATRLAHLEKEKDLTRQFDRLKAERRRMPMEKVEKQYFFDGPAGKKSLLDLFEGRRQLIVYHFMFDPDWEKGCPGCTGYVNAIGDLSDLNNRNTTFTLVSRAPLAKLEKYKKDKGWKHSWYSSFGSDFNYDFNVTLDEKVKPIVYNYRPKAEIVAKKIPNPTQGEAPGLSVFFQLDGGVYHTYSTYSRGAEALTDGYALLDVTPYGRQEDFEDSPVGWPQKPTYGDRPVPVPVELGRKSVAATAS